MQIGSRIKKLRNMQKYKAKEFAKLSGISPVFLSYIENDTKKPSFDTLERMCSILNITLSDFFKEDFTASHEVLLTDDIKKLILTAQYLKPDQLNQLIKFVDTIIKK